MTTRQIRMIQDLIPVAAAIFAVIGAVVTAAMSYQRLESLAEQVNEVNRTQDQAIAEIKSDTTQYMRSIDQRLSRIEGFLDKKGN